MTVKNEEGNILSTDKRIYKVENFHFPHNRVGYLGLKYWDITAMDTINLGIKPHETDTLISIVPLPKDTRSVQVETTFNFLYEKGESAVIRKVVDKVPLESP